MILTALKHYIEKKHSVSQQELAQYFSLTSDGIDAMVSVLIKKGYVSKIQDINSQDRLTRVRYVFNRSDGLSVSVIC